MTAQVNEHEFKFLVKRKRKVNFNDKKEALLNKVLKNKVSFETYCRIENHDDFNHALKKRIMISKMVPLPLCLIMAVIGYFYVGIISVLIMLLLVVMAWLFVSALINRNLKYAVPSVILWGFVYDSLHDEEFRAIFKERLYGKDILFREDLEFLQAEQQKLFEEAKAKGQDLTPDLKGKIL